MEEDNNNNHCSMQRDWNQWAEDQFNEDRMEEADENISNILALQRQKERGLPFIF